MLGDSKIRKALQIDDATPTLTSDESRWGRHHVVEKHGLFPQLCRLPLKRRPVDTLLLNEGCLQFVQPVLDGRYLSVDGEPVGSPLFLLLPPHRWLRAKAGRMLSLASYQHIDS